MMRILHVVNSLAVGGLESLVVEMASAVSNRYSTIAFPVCALSPSDSHLSVKSAHRDVETYELNKESYVLKIKPLLKIVRDKKIDIIHTHNSGPLLNCIFLSKIVNTPLVHTKHGVYIPNGKKSYFFNHMAYKMANKIVAVSCDTKQSIIQGYKIPNPAISVIANGINTATFRPPSDIKRIRSNIGLDSDAYIIGTVGRLSPEKGHMLLIDILPSIIAAIPQVKLVVVGGGIAENELKQKAKELNISKNIVFLGERADVCSLMQCFDVYAQTSSMEGMSLTILEAMSCGLPIVASNVGGNPEVIVEGETGFLLSLKDPQAIVSAIIKLYNDKDLAMRMGKAGRKRVEEKFGINRMIDEYIAIYEKCLRKTVDSRGFIPWEK